MAELLVENLRKEYPTPASPLVVLDGVDLSLRSGDSLAIVGPSGSGKSTLLAILGVLDRPTSGSMTLDGRDPFALPDGDLPGFRARHIGFVFQDHHLLPQCTVLENVLAPLLADGAATDGDQTKAKKLLQRVGLSDRLTHRPAELSGGERQRVAIARALIRDPLLLLADEPTGNLDQATGQRIAELLLELHAQRDSILITVTHSQALAEQMAQQRRLEAGRLIEP
ncbi:MAG: ABC transporter ATP-binding protein [Planctomycetota bacterium]